MVFVGKASNGDVFAIAAGGGEVEVACAPGYVGDPCVEIDGCENDPCFPGVECVDEKPPLDSYQCGSPCPDGEGGECSRCPKGYFGDGTKEGCEDIDECTSSPCDPETTCTNGVGEFTCSECPGGFRGTGLIGCTRISGCETNNGGCDERVSCAALDNGASECGPCPLGYSGTGETGCKDIDGCADDPCSPLSTCTDVPADEEPYEGHRCSPCPVGTAGDGQGLEGCVEFDGCADSPCWSDDSGTLVVPCFDVPYGEADPDGDGSDSVCGNCPVRYKGNGVGPTGCEPSSACAVKPCFPGVACKDETAPKIGFICGGGTEGGSNPCPMGYAGDARGETGCTDVDECALCTSGGGGRRLLAFEEGCPCDALTACENSQGSLSCSACPSGFRGDGLTGCKPETTCAESNGGCAALANCTDTDLGSSCGDCPSPGFEGSGDTSCTDTNGCADKPCFVSDDGAFTVPCADVPGLDVDPSGDGKDHICCVSPGDGGPDFCCPPGFKGNGKSCSICEVDVRIKATTLVDGVAKRASDFRAFAEMEAMADGCNPKGGYKWQWSLESSDPAFRMQLDSPGLLSVTKANSKDVLIPKKSLPSGAATYTIKVQVCLAGNFLLCAVAEEAFTVKSSALVPIITGGGGTAGEDNEIAVDALLSTDPDGEDGEMAYAWRCEQSGNPCYGPDGVTPAVIKNEVSFATRLLGGGRAAGGLTYSFFLNVSKDARQAGTSTQLIVEKGAPPIVRIIPLSTSKVNANQRLVLSASVTSLKPASLRLRWSMLAGPDLDLDDPAIALTPRTSDMLLLAPNALVPGESYTFVIQCQDNNGIAQAQIVPYVNLAPVLAGGVDSAVTADPLGGGIALETPFALATSRAAWDDDDLPLSFKWSYIIGGTEEEVPLNDYQPVPGIAGVFLPAGLEEHGFSVTIVLRARDTMGAESAPVYMGTVVTWPELEDETAVSRFVDDKARAADDALANGDTDTAQQLISGITALLNSQSGPANGTEGGGGRRLLAAAALGRSSKSGLSADERASRMAQRRNLLATSRSAMDLTVSSTGSLARSSQIVSRICAAVDEIDEETQDSALSISGGILGDISSPSGKASSLELTEGAAKGIFSTADGVAGAVTVAATGSIAAAAAAAAAAPEGAAAGAGGDARAVATRSGVRGLLNRMAGVQIGSMIPGEAASESIGENVGVRVQRAYVDPLQSSKSISPLFDIATSSSVSFRVPSEAAAKLAADAADVLAGCGGARRLLQEGGTPTAPTQDPAANPLATGEANSTAGYSGNCAGAGALDRVDVGVLLTSTKFDDLLSGAALREAANRTQGNATNATIATAPAFAAPLSGVVSLSLVAGGDGAEMPLSGLLRPIYFSIPLEASALEGAKNVSATTGNSTEGGAGVNPDQLVSLCGWWDRSLAGGGAYSTDGCYTLPNPRPPGAIVSWVPGFTLNAPNYNQTYWHRSWDFDHALTAGCSVSYDADEYRVYRDAREGAQCNASSSSNPFQCWWDVDAQSFRGPGCEFAGTQECACSHLTDFKVSLSIPKTRVTIASAEEMRLSFDEVWRIKELLGITAAICLLGVALAGLAHCYVLRARGALLARLREPRHAFQEVCGVWTWPFHQIMVAPSDSNQMDAPVMIGPGPANAAVMAMYYNRIRAALPHEVIKATVLVDESALLSVKTEVDGSSIQARLQKKVESLADRTRGSKIYAELKRLREAGDLSEPFKEVLRWHRQIALGSVIREFSAGEGEEDAAGGVGATAGAPMGATAGAPVVDTAGDLAGTTASAPMGATAGAPMGATAGAPVDTTAGDPAGTIALVIGAGPVSEGTGEEVRKLGQERDDILLKVQELERAARWAPGGGDGGDFPRFAPPRGEDFKSLRRLGTNIFTRPSAARKNGAGDEVFEMPPIHVKVPVEGRDEPEDGPLEDVGDRMIGTAIMLAVLSLRNVVKPAVLLEQTKRATKLFPPGKIKGLTFTDHFNFFKVMLSFPGRGWYTRARMWNFVYLQRKDGRFFMNRDFAKAMYARDKESPDFEEPNPKEFDEWALERSIPLELTRLEAEGGTGDVDTVELWCTLLALGYLEGDQRDFVMQESTQIREVDGGGVLSYNFTEEETVVSRAHAAVRHMVTDCEADDELRELMPMLRARAHEVAQGWLRQQLGLIRRIMKQTNSQRTIMDRFEGVKKFFKAIMRSAMHTHPVVRCLKAPISSSFTRPDRVLNLFSLWLGGLTVSIWLNAERAVNCCQSAAVHVGCGLPAGAVPSESAPCDYNGYTLCRDLVGDPALGNDGDFECDAFPVPGEPFHLFITVMIIFAVLLPVDKGLGFVVEFANTADVPDRWREQTLFQKFRRRFRKTVDKSMVTYLSVAFLDEGGSPGGEGGASEGGEGEGAGAENGGKEPAASPRTPREGPRLTDDGSFKRLLRMSDGERGRKAFERKESLVRRLEAAKSECSDGKISVPCCEDLKEPPAHLTNKWIDRKPDTPAVAPRGGGAGAGGVVESLVERLGVAVGGGALSSGPPAHLTNKWMDPRSGEGRRGGVKSPASSPDSRAVGAGRAEWRRATCGDERTPHGRARARPEWSEALSEAILRDESPPAPADRRILHSDDLWELEQEDLRQGAPPPRAHTVQAAGAGGKGLRASLADGELLANLRRTRLADGSPGAHAVPSAGAGSERRRARLTEGDAGGRMPPPLRRARLTEGGAGGRGGRTPRAGGGGGAPPAAPGTPPPAARANEGPLILQPPAPPDNAPAPVPAPAPPSLAHAKSFKPKTAGMLGFLARKKNQVHPEVFDHDVNSEPLGLPVEASGGAPLRRTSLSARNAKSRFRIAGQAVQATVTLSNVAKIRKAARDAVLAVSNGLTDAFLDMEQKRVRKAWLISWSGKAAFMASWATFSYFILVYGLKMYDNIGPGKEMEFISTWINYILIDSLCLQWNTSIKNATYRTIISFAADMFGSRLDPFTWFEKYDDDVMHDSMDEELLEDMDEVEDMEADDFTNPFAA